jgi:cobalt-zinc-cadmium efflux system protein
MPHDMKADTKSGAAVPRLWTVRERRQLRRVATAMVVLALFFCVQFTGAILARSDVLRVEALHILTDVAALGLALLAMHVARHHGAGRPSHGLHRAEPIAALVNAALVLGATALLVKNAIEDLGSGATPDADVMLWVAICAVVINGASAWLIHGAIDPMHRHGHGPLSGAAGSEGLRGAGDPPCQQGHVYVPGHEVHEGHSLNLRGAFLHLAGDALGSTAAVVAAVLIRFGVSSSADPIAALVVAGILVYAAARLIRDAAHVLFSVGRERAAAASFHAGEESGGNHDELGRDT